MIIRCVQCQTEYSDEAKCCPKCSRLSTSQDGAQVIMIKESNHAHKKTMRKNGEHLEMKNNQSNSNPFTQFINNEKSVVPYWIIAILAIGIGVYFLQKGYPNYAEITEEPTCFSPLSKKYISPDELLKVIYGWLLIAHGMAFTLFRLARAAWKS